MRPWQFTATSTPDQWPARVALRAVREDGRVVVKPMFGSVPLTLGDWIVAGKDGIRHVVSADEFQATRPKEEKPKAKK